MTQKYNPPKPPSISDYGLGKILKDHKKWLESGGEQGQRADLSEASLRGADLREADLRQAILRGADLRQADLFKANLSGADLRVANLREVSLSSADLSNADLSQADLTGAYLYHVDLRRADLSGASLLGAELLLANLAGANLAEADLTQADLIVTNLTGADLTEVNLTWANLNDVDLDRADFSRAQTAWTVFGEVDLSKAKGLETIRHEGPSTVGLDTIHSSQGKIPESFLRQAGVPELFITNMRALVTALKPIQFYSCFISYSHKDQDFAERLHADLKAKGVRCWFTPQRLRISDKRRPAIEQAIHARERVLLVLSDHSIDSPWMEKEVETALGKENKAGRRVLFPIRLDEAIMEIKEPWADDIRRSRHIGDFSNWKDHDQYQRSFARLLDELQAVS